MGHARNVVLILVITAAMALATSAIVFVFDRLYDVANVVAVWKG